MNSKVLASTKSGLEAMYAEDETAQNFFRWAAGRQNDATQTSIDHLAQRSGADRRKAVELAKQLEQLGCGEFVVGRRGAKSRIVWSYSLKSIGKAAIGSADEIESIDPELLADTDDLKGESPQETSGVFTIADAKQRLAASFGVAPEAIEITVRG